MGCSTSKSSTAVHSIGAPQTSIKVNNSEKEATKDQKKEKSDVISSKEAKGFLESELHLPAERAENLVIMLASYNGEVIKFDLDTLIDSILEGTEKLKPVFKEQDADGKGSIPMDDCVELLGIHIKGLTNTVILTMLEKHPGHQGECVDFYSFVDFYAIIKAKKLSVDRTFMYLDKDKSGDLDKSEILNTLILELGVDEQKANEFIAAFDVDQSGTIDKEEFTVMWTKLTM